MILTRTHLNIRRPGARKLLGSPQAMHAAVMSGFPPGVDPGRPLWRVDLDDPLRPTLFVVSPTRPDMTHLEEQAGWPSAPTTVSAPYTLLLDALEVGQQWAFRLTANPTHRATIDGVQKVLAHVTVAQQTAWLVSRQEALGVSLGDADQPTFHLTGREVRRFRRDTSTVTLARATFDGTLNVTNPDLLRTALTAGVGRGKAYGCGLLTLAKP